jgi:tetratricopeptide (TPR) repeat protein
MIISLLRKTALVLFGVVLFFVLLEGGLRLGGLILSSMQESENLRSIKQKGAYRILCLGESTTQGQYPHLLEQVLNQRNIGVRFSVIDKGKTETKTPMILSRVESYLAEYHPDMVVAMMGNNDKRVKYYEDIPESDAWLFKHCHVYRLGRILYMQVSKKIKQEDIYGLSRSDSNRKADPKDTRAVVKKATHSNEIPAEKVRRSESESQKGSPGSNGRFAGDEKSLGKDAAFRLAETPRSVMEGVPTPDDECVRSGTTLYREQDKFIEAEASLKKAIELNPKNNNAYVELGRLYRLQDKLPQAENVFKKAIEINPKNDRAFVELGWIYSDQGKPSQSDDSFMKALAVNPENDFNQVTMGGVYRRHGKFLQAEDAYKKAIELNPANEFALLELGGLYREQGKFSQAEDLFKEAIGTNFEKVPERTWRAMASLYEEMGKPELAKAYAEKAASLNSENYPPITVNNYHKLKEILDRKRIQLVCVQYPMRNAEPLKRIFEKDEGITFVDNERVFKEAVKRSGYKEYFRDMFAGDFGHCTRRGNELLAQNIADVILKEVFNK